MKKIKTYKEFKEPTVSWEELAKDFREDKSDNKKSVASKPFSAQEIEKIPPANMVVIDSTKKS